MTFPPVIDRELRVASRRRGTYWTRFGIAAAAIILGGAIQLTSLDAPQKEIGPVIFMALAILAFLYALLSGRVFTADCLSSEKRDGTLGLLFLTDLKGYDVVLGKLAATSLNGFLGLLALVPVLAIPLMMGGVTAGQFWRIVLVLLNTFFFSLALGIFVSAICRDYRRAAGTCLGLLLLLTFFIPGALLLIANLAGASEPPFFTCYLSPLFSFVVAFDEPRQITGFSFATDFWISAGLIHVLAWLFIGLASHVVPYSWQDRAVKTRKMSAPEPGSRRRWGNGEWRIVYRRRLLSVNPFFWLASRNPFKPAQVWIFLACMGAWWIWGRLAAGDWFEYETTVMLCLLMNTTLKLWVLIEAGQRLGEDQRAGALELVLSTPLTSREILRGQFLALRRQFLRPVVVVVALELIFVAASFQPSLRTSAVQMATFVMFALILLIADAVAASWVAMRFALISRSPQRAATSAFLRILVLPWIVFGLVNVGANLFVYFMDIHAGGSEIIGWLGELALWFSCGIIADLWFGFRARWQLLTNFRQLATEPTGRKRAPLAA